MRSSVRLRLAALALAVAVCIGATGALASRALDLDADGLTGAREVGAGTSPWRADTDRDGLADGWETERGLDPFSEDSDDDGLSDRRETEAATDPRSADTDGDGIPDAQEWAIDCDGDGAIGARDTDDDGDRRPDAQEPAEERCMADADGDGVLDGLEGAVVCVRLVDCDADGLLDGQEQHGPFDPLDPDTFSIHLPDSIPFAFAKAGQPAGGDADADGIPDPWETGAGLIDWGVFDPQPGRRDLLLEVVRVVGPDTGRFSGLSLAATYDALRSVFAAEGIELQLRETIVRLPEEPLPVLLPTRNAEYYRSVLDNATGSANPYVLTVVLNPQHDQSEVLHAGVAPIRGMLAAVDLGQHVVMQWKTADGRVTVEMSPLYESLIRAGRISQTGYVGGIRDDGKYFLRVSDAEVRWTPHWFRSPTLVRNGVESALQSTEVRLESSALAHTVLHEMGHTLGLCHPHESSCARLLPPDERLRVHESSMSYTSPDTLVQFLPGEWARVQTFLQCPPPQPVQLVAQNASREAVLDAKYAYDLESEAEINVRSCGDFQAIAADLHPANGTVYQPAAGWQAPPIPQSGLGGAVAYAVATVAAAAGAAWGSVRRVLAVRARH